VKASPAKKPAKIVLHKKKTVSTKSLARSGPNKQKAAAKLQKAAKQAIKPPKKLVDPRFDPYAIGAPRGLSRRGWRQLYHGRAPAWPPPGYIPAPRTLRRY
jgi:hypothetical protein